MQNLTTIDDSVRRRNPEASDIEVAKCESSERIVAAPIDEAEIRRQLDDLVANPLDADAVFFFESFVFEGREELLPAWVKPLVADAIADVLHAETKPGAGLRSAVFIAWGSHRPDHGPACRAMLRSPNCTVRTVALGLCARFLEPSDFDQLLAFQTDDFVVEATVPGGPLRFILRDAGLALLERLTGAPVSEAQGFEVVAGRHAAFRSWTPFLNWWNKNRFNKN